MPKFHTTTFPPGTLPSRKWMAESGGTIAVEAFEGPGVGRKACFTDPDGNIFGIPELTGS